MKQSGQSYTQQDLLKQHPRDQFTIEEDIQLTQLVITYGENHWDTIASLMPYRNKRQCRERWFYFLSPSINNKPFSHEEDQQLIDLYKKHGSKWKLFTKYFQGRTTVSLRNRISLLKRKMTKSGKKSLEIFQNLKNNKKNTKSKRTIKKFHQEKPILKDECPNKSTEQPDFFEITEDYDIFSDFFINDSEFTFF